MEKEEFVEGRALLRQPVMPLVSMLQFLYMAGPFATVGEVVDELPDPIETDRATYEQPGTILREYLDILEGFEGVKNGTGKPADIVDEQDRPVDAFTGGIALIQQQVLTRELEKVNSLLCQPCGCTLCCTGPDREMTQEFFEIPLQAKELELFSQDRFDDQASRDSLPGDEKEYQVDGRPFYQGREPVLIHWKKGWSLILPRGSRCPHLEDSGQCREYPSRPDVCRRPQIFPYAVEKISDRDTGQPILRIRQSLLAIVDCPYVERLQDEIAEYAAASDLQLILTRNKQ